MMRSLIAFSVVGTAVVTATLLQREEPQEPLVAAAEQRSVPEGPDRPRGVPLLRRAIQLQADSQFAAAIATYDSAAAELPQIADWIAVYSAGSASYLGDTLEVSRRLALTSDSLRLQWGWRARVRAFTVARVRQRALDIATAATTSGTSQKRAEAWYRVAELQRDLGHPAAQKAALLEVMQVAPETQIARDAAFALSEKSDLSIQERLRAGRALLGGSDKTRGVQQLERAMAGGTLPLAERAQIRYEIGRALFNAGKYADAARQLDRVVRTHARGAEARFLFARATYRQGKEDDALRVFRSVANEYPASAAATRSLYHLADLAQDKGNSTEAAALFEKAAAAPAKVEQSAHALMRRGAIAFVQQDYRKAGEIFERFRARYPDGSHYAQATYWAAQSYLRADQDAKGKELLRDLRSASPLSYYGMRAATALGDKQIASGLSDGPRADPGVAQAVEPGLDRWQLLRDVEWNDAAALELRNLKQKFKDNRAALYVIAEQLSERGAPNLGITAGRELLSGGMGWDKRLLRITYPMPYRSVIEREARSYGLDPHFVAGVIRQESQFNHKAVSPAGAVGLMQVMPATGRQLAPKLNVGPVTKATLTEPEVNIRLGTKFLADLVNVYGKRTDAVLIAYNAGPSRAARWRGFPEFGTQDLFVERIPFDETRDYVKIVSLNTAIYRALYASPESAD